MDKRKFSLFVSSTYEDLKEERQALFQVALESNFIPVGMEQFHAAPASQWNVITKMIDECDFYLLIIGGRYGSIDDKTGKSYTENEYDYAKKKGLPVLVLIRKKEAITSDNMDDEDKYKKQEMLDTFRTKVKNESNTIDYFGDIDSLKYSASQSLKNAVNYADHDAGWVRYKDVVEIANKKIEEQSNANSKQQSSILDYSTITAADIDAFFKVENETLLVGRDRNHKEELSSMKTTSSVMLFFAAEDNGEILVSTDLSKRDFQAGNNPLNIDNSRREAAKWEDALENLVDIGCIKLGSSSITNKIYYVTEKGFQLTELLKNDPTYDISRAPNDVLKDLMSQIDYKK